MYTHYQRDEYNATLRGVQGVRKFDEMRRSDAQVRASLRLLKTPVLAGRWYMEPASDAKKDINIAKFTWRCLNEFMSISWTECLTQALLMLDFGYFMFEKVYDLRKVEGEFRVVWKKLAPRHPLDVQQWYFDRQGGPLGVEMVNYDLNTPTRVVIPIDKLLVFTNDKEAGNITGMSALRSAYKHWYFKDNLYKIDAIQKERHGIGIPIIKLPPNFSGGDKRLADEIGRNLRVNEKAHVVIPPLWEIEFAKLEGQPVNAMESVEHHNRMITTNILGAFLDKTGDVSADNEIFLKASRFVADVVRDTFNKYAIPQLVDYNFMYTGSGYPQLKVRRVGETADWRTLSFAIRNFVGADIIRADEHLEAWVRDEMDLPRRDEATDRKVAQLELQHAEDVMPVEPQGGDPTNTPTKSQGARPGLPRQAKKPPVNAGQSHSGQDKSGG
jgi:hypothetical protein